MSVVPAERLTAAAQARLEAWRTACGQGKAPSPPDARLIVDVALAAVRQPEPSDELLEALATFMRGGR